MFRFLSSSFQHQGWVSQILISDIQWMSERYNWWVRAIDNFQLNSDRNDPIAGGGELLWWRDVFACESHAERHWLRDFHVKRADQDFQWPCSRLGGNSIALSIFVDILVELPHIYIFVFIKGSFMWKGLTKTKTNQRCQWPQSPTGTGRNCETIQRVGVD